MNVLHNPTWLDGFIHSYRKFDEIPDAVFDEINADLDKNTSINPTATIVIIAWNEEINILNCIASISKSNTTTPFEVIVVNNNSSDSTQKTIDKLHVRSFFQPIQGWGPARQLGLINAKGKYLLLADADCLYPEHWVEKMVSTLQKPEVVCAYGRYSFIASANYARWQLFLYEKMKDAIAFVRHFRRPYLNAMGMSMGLIREYGLKNGFIMYKTRGEDGRMCHNLMNWGKIKQVKTDMARVWTEPRSIKKEGSLPKAAFMRIIKEMRRMPSFIFSGTGRSAKK